MLLADRLQEETRAHHARLEAQPCFRALVSGELPREAWSALLHTLALFHQGLERALAAASHPALAAASAGLTPLSPLLEEDRARLGPGKGAASALLVAPLALGERMRTAARHQPVALVGHLYALRLGLLPKPAPRLPPGLPPAESPGHLVSREDAPWNALAQRLSGQALTEEEQAQVVRAVREDFSLAREVLEALHPGRAVPPVAWLNRAAGGHPITSEVEELRAALRSAEATWEEYPYYVWRYGERGRHFSWSDSGWLVTLGGQPEDTVWRQVSWLAGLLAARGMPRRLLERHLATLHEELVEARPERRQAYGVFRWASERLAGERRAFLGDEALRALEADFVARVGPDWGRQLRGTGELLGAAVADEHCGVAQAVSSLVGWLTEPSRFPPEWLRAVHEVLAQARQRCAEG